jgi:O-antigen ligase
VPANFLAAEKGYGVTIDLTRYDDEELADTLDTLRENGFTWLRLPLAWAEIESERGQFDWGPLDRVVQQVKPDHFKLIAVLHTSPDWARPDSAPPATPPTELSDFSRFARTLAAQYGPQIDYYQIWHEPNLSATWGEAFVDPNAYADLLREAALNIRAADPEAYILTAALAPTLEEGPLNLNEPAYLEQLYQARANRWFDIVAAQPYGFDSEPEEPAQEDRLNLRRVELVREVMLAHGDADTPIWATAFGWNARSTDWSGQPSPWHSAPTEEQARRTAAAIEQARRDWPWLGPVLALRWDAAGLAPDDPARGFALLETPPILAAFRSAAAGDLVATPGRYPADHPTGHYRGDWRFAANRSDIPRHEPRTLVIPFEGSRLDLTVNRGPFRGYLWVTIDGQPANGLPRDGQGRSYVVLYDPLRESEAVTLAQNLPPGRHQAVIEAEGGWGQWAIDGWSVYHQASTTLAGTGLVVAGVTALASGLGLLWLTSRAPATIGKVLWAWGEILVALLAIFGETGQIILIFALAAGVYLIAGSVALLLLPLLALALLVRPDLGLALTAFSLSFFQEPLQLPLGSFSPVELVLLLTLAGFLFRTSLSFGRSTYAARDSNSQFIIHNSQFTIHHLRAADYAALVLVILAFLSTLGAENFGVSMREWRVVVFESVLFYFLVRLGLDFRPPSPRKEDARAGQWRWAWRLVDAFVAGAALQALIALYLYFFTDQSITAEGVRRALGPAYGSPNNLSLFLDRAWPILLAVTVLPGLSAKRRRWLYGAGLVLVSLALYLTFSKGALLVGLPAGLAAMALFHLLVGRQQHWRRWLAIAGSGIAVIILALIPLSRTARFQTTFNLSEGSTGFFRLKLWQASAAMLQDHWPLGVGLDNFLYQYRTRYILPEAWQEPNLSHPHNLVLDFGTRLGLGGIALLLWLQVAFWQAAWRLYRWRPEPLVLGLMGSMVVFLSHGLVDNSYFLVDLAFAFFLTVGLVQRLEELTVPESPES